MLTIIFSKGLKPPTSKDAAPTNSDLQWSGKRQGRVVPTSTTPSMEKASHLLTT